MKRITFCIVLIGWFLSSCIEEFEPNFQISEAILVVEGEVTDLLNTSFVQIQVSRPTTGRNSFFRPVENAVVNIIENGETIVELAHTERGIYKPVNDFQGKVGSKYQLEFTTQEGEVYQSNVEELLATPEIDSIYQTTEEAAYTEGSVTVASNFIYVDTVDPEETENYYLWSWTNFELTPTCITCEGGRWFPGPRIEGRCIQEPFLVRRGSILDYECEDFCFDIFRSTLINVQSDEFTNGLTIQARKVAEIPYYNLIGGLIEVKQQSLSKEAYDYFTLLINQGQETGGLDDTPPAPLIGNIFNINKRNDAVSGFFLATGSTKKSYWIDRFDGQQKNFRPLGLLKGREIRLEAVDTSTDPPRPPKSPCLSSPTRTNIAPEGFKVELFIEEEEEDFRNM